MKSTPPSKGAAACDADGNVLVSNSATFRITHVVSVDYGAKKAELTVEIDAVGALFIEIFKPQDRPPFAAPKSIRSKYTGAFERAFRLDDELAAEILEAYQRREARV